MCLTNCLNIEVLNEWEVWYDLSSEITRHLRFSYSSYMLKENTESIKLIQDITNLLLPNIFLGFLEWRRKCISTVDKGWWHFSHFMVSYNPASSQVGDMRVRVFLAPVKWRRVSRRVLSLLPVSTCCLDPWLKVKYFFYGRKNKTESVEIRMWGRVDFSWREKTR